jgi:hypothetical protein
MHIDDAVCSAPTNEDGKCSTTATREYAWDDTEFEGELCEGGTPTIDSSQFETLLPMPKVDESNSSGVTWGCNGIGTGTSTQSDKCSATRTGPNPGICGPNDGEKLSEKPTDDLCYNPDETTSVDNNYLNGVVDSDKEEWIWTCNGSHNDFSKCPKQLSKDCKATCVPEIDATAKPNPFLLTEDGVTVEVTVEKKGNCAGAYT